MGRVRDAVSTSRGDSDAEAMQNLAYVVSSANENIVALQRTVKLQEKELTDKSEHTAALQRNYETLSRIRQSDQKEFIALKAQQAEEREELERLKGLYEEEQQKTLMLEQKLQTTAEAEAQLQHAKLELANAARERDEFRVAGEKHQRAAAEAVEGNRSLKLNLDKLTRSQQELLSRAKKAEDALSTVEGEREAGDKANAQALAKLAVQERQLKTFLEANMALEGDLGRQVQRVAQLERRKQELEAEQATIEAYYQARAGCSTWPSWWGHGWPPSAHQAAREGLRLPSALERSGSAPQIPRRARDLGASALSRCHFCCVCPYIARSHDAISAASAHTSPGAPRGDAGAVRQAARRGRERQAAGARRGLQDLR